MPMWLGAHYFLSLRFYINLIYFLPDVAMHFMTIRYVINLKKKIMIKLKGYFGKSIYLLRDVEKDPCPNL